MKQSRGGREASMAAERRVVKQGLGLAGRDMHAGWPSGEVQVCKHLSS